MNDEPMPVAVTAPQVRADPRAHSPGLRPTRQPRCLSLPAGRAQPGDARTTQSTARQNKAASDQQWSLNRSGWHSCVIRVQLLNSLTRVPSEAVTVYQRQTRLKTWRFAVAKCHLSTVRWFFDHPSALGNAAWRRASSPEARRAVSCSGLYQTNERGMPTQFLVKMSMTIAKYRRKWLQCHAAA